MHIIRIIPEIQKNKKFSQGKLLHNLFVGGRYLCRIRHRAHRKIKNSRLENRSAVRGLDESVNQSERSMSSYLSRSERDQSFFYFLIYQRAGESSRGERRFSQLKDTVSCYRYLSFLNCRPLVLIKFNLGLLTTILNVKQFVGKI